MHRLVTLLAFLMIVSACENLPGPFPGDSPSETDSLRIGLDLSSSDIDELHDIRADFSIENITEDTLRYTFRSGCKSEFVISQNGTEIVDSRDGRACPAVISHLTLAPGESKTYEISTESMPNRELAGMYKLTAFLLDNKEIKASTTFTAE